MRVAKTLAILNPIALGIHIALSYLTQFKLVNTLDVGEVSARYPSLFTPAPITFTVWGVIYIWLILFCVYHLVRSRQQLHSDPANQALVQIGPWFIINNLLTASWLLAWTREWIGACAVLIILQLVSLIIIHLRMHIYRVRTTTGMRFLSQAPLSIYFGWITIATIANMASWLNASGFNGGLSQTEWTIVMIFVAAVIASLVVITRKNAFYGLVVLWALYGIASKHASSTGNFDIMRTAWICFGAVGLVTVLQLVRNALLSRAPGDPLTVPTHSLK